MAADISLEGRVYKTWQGYVRHVSYLFNVEALRQLVIDDADGLLPPNDPARIADEAAPAKKKPKSKKGSSIQHVELAKAGRAKCQISGKQIERGELRLGVANIEVRSTTELGPGS